MQLRELQQLNVILLKQLNPVQYKVAVYAGKDNASNMVIKLYKRHSMTVNCVSFMTMKAYM